ncbi:hypothetical protein L1049_006890 [Liquidambar formosana]|uniref:Purple acid phosphatase N-terminal domain-containing protein n=1 Tax=Liquidambar formosana TaxID=63359 RepID=A0AAP0RGK2_LIQFO
MVPLQSFLILLLFLTHQSSSQVTLSISPQTLSKSGDSVRVQWSTIDLPSHLDWLGFYSPHDSSHDNFIGYIFLSSSPTWQSGSGNLSFPLVNLRSDYDFRIFRWNETDPIRLDQDRHRLPGTSHLLSRSERLGFERGRGPEQIHLAYTERWDEMRVMFVTEDGEESFVK